MCVVYFLQLCRCLQQAAKEVSHALNNCVNFLPGQKDVDEAIKAVVNSSQSLAVEDVSEVHYFPYPGPCDFHIKYTSSSLIVIRLTCNLDD